MRETCQVVLPSDDLCGKPAVDFLDEQGDGSEWCPRVYLCAEHWDEGGLGIPLRIA
jgi:hypothetical protein